MRERERDRAKRRTKFETNGNYALGENIASISYLPPLFLSFFLSLSLPLRVVAKIQNESGTHLNSNRDPWHYSDRLSPKIESSVVSFPTSPSVVEYSQLTFHYSSSRQCLRVCVCVSL